MSVKLTIPSPTGGNYIVEVPLGSVAATDARTSYAETQSMIVSFTAKTVQSLLGPDASANAANVEVRDRRLLASCFVERAGARTTNAGLGDPDALVVAVVQAGGATGPSRGRVYRYIVRNYTPLRRVLNAYAGQRKRDVQTLKLMWQGERVGWDDTAEKVSILFVLICMGKEEEWLTRGT